MDDVDAAFPRIVREHQDRVFSLALRLCDGDRSRAEELAHDVFVKAYRALVRYDAGRRRSLALRPWLATITLNEARNVARTSSRRRDHVTRDGALPERADGVAATPEDAAVRAGQRDVLVAALDGLPAAQRDALVLRHIAGLSYAEVSDALGRPAGTVKSDVHRAVLALRNLMTKEDAT